MASIKKIDSFKKPPYEFLSNFWMVDVELDGDIYPSVEHAYQAAKVTDGDQRLPFQKKSSNFFNDLSYFQYTSAEAKKAGKKLQMIRADWKDIKLNIMLDLLRKKFEYSWLRKMLLETGDAELIEGNWWGDIFWGVCNGVGENHLGRLLMQVRSEIKEGVI